MNTLIPQTIVRAARVIASALGLFVCTGGSSCGPGTLLSESVEGEQVLDEMQPLAGNVRTYGSAFLEPLPATTSSFEEIVALKYRFKVADNQCNVDGLWKIIFLFHSFGAYGVPLYNIQTNFYSWANRYSGSHCGTWPPVGAAVTGETSLFFSIPDEQFDFKVGARTLSPTIFPYQAILIDGINDLWKHEHVSQANLNNLEGEVLLVRGGTVTDPVDWGCNALPAGTYRIWTATARSGNSGDFSVSFLLPEEHGRYLFRQRPTQIATEAFFINPGLFRMYFWDLMIQREGESEWDPLRQWRLTWTDAADTGNTWGMKRATFDDHDAIEVSNDGTPTYLRQSETLVLGDGGGGNEDIALGKPTSASSEYSAAYGAQHATDGEATGWSSSATDSWPWLQIDLGHPHSIERVDVVFRQECCDQPMTRRNFEVRASSDESFRSYVVLGGVGDDAFPHKSTMSISVATQTGYRFLRVSKTAPEYFFLAEVSVFGRSL